MLGKKSVVIETKIGEELVGIEYEPLLPYATELVKQSGQKGFYVVSDSYVTLTDGTGVVHIAPAFGEDDARMGREYDLPFVQLVREDGTMSDEVTDFTGQFCKDADAGIIQKLKADGLLLELKNRA